MVAEMDTLVDTCTDTKEVVFMAACSVVSSTSGPTTGTVGRAWSAGVGSVVPVSPEGMEDSEVYWSLSVTPSTGGVGGEGAGEGEGRAEGKLGTPGCSVGGVAMVEVSSESVVAGVAVVVVGVVNELVVRAGRKNTTTTVSACEPRGQTLLCGG